jgi:hypothetical protein
MTKPGGPILQSGCPAFAVGLKRDEIRSNRCNHGAELKADITAPTIEVI